MAGAQSPLAQALLQAQAPDNSYDPFAAEKFANPAIDSLLSGAAKFVATPRAPDDPSHVLAQIGNIGTITNADVDRAMNVAMASGPGMIRPYQNVPDALMGFRKMGQQKGFDESAYPHSQGVEVTLPETSISPRETFRDDIKGMNADHALERAWRNWPAAMHITPVNP